MSKIVFVCLSLISGFLIGFLAFPTLEVYYQILISIGFSIASLLALIILFFIIKFTLVLYNTEYLLLSVIIFILTTPFGKRSDNINR